MKSYKHLFDICISEANRRRAVKSAKKSKRIREMIRRRNLSDDELIGQSYDWIINYENAEHEPKIIQDGIRHKERKIIVPTLEELIVQHCVVQALQEMFWKGMYQHSYASIPRRGAHKAKKVIEKWIDTDPKNVKYVLKMDIHHFFDSIPHDILKRMLTRKIHDERMLELLFKILDVTEVACRLGFTPRNGCPTGFCRDWIISLRNSYTRSTMRAIWTTWSFSGQTRRFCTKSGLPSQSTWPLNWGCHLRETGRSFVSLTPSMARTKAVLWTLWAFSFIETVPCYGSPSC